MNELILCQLLIMLLSCTNSSQDDYSGIYIRHASNEFGREFDTIEIKKTKQSEKDYQIEHRWKFQREITGETWEPEYKVQTKSGTWDAYRGFLIEGATGDRFSFSYDRRSMFNGSNQYRKIN